MQIAINMGYCQAGLEYKPTGFGITYAIFLAVIDITVFDGVRRAIG